MKMMQQITIGYIGALGIHGFNNGHKYSKKKLIKIYYYVKVSILIEHTYVIFESISNPLKTIKTIKKIVVVFLIIVQGLNWVKWAI